MLSQTSANVTDELKGKESQSNGLKSAIVTLLESNQEIGMKCDLSCYPTHDGFFFVDYVYCEETVDLLNLDDQQKNTIKDEEELVEIFDNAEEAADFYLKLTNGKMTICSDKQHGHGHTSNGAGSGKKRTLKQKIVAYDKDKYF